jgi:hypothetical protein
MKPMNDRLYFLLRRAADLNLWGGELLGGENLPRRGPAVFVANHLGALGPIGVVCSLPLRLTPWISAEMVDPALAPEYLREDFVERELGLRPPLSGWLAGWICRLAVPLLHALGCIPVYADYRELGQTFACSLDRLLQGGCLLIFPEDPQGAPDPLTGMRPFRKGYLRLGELYYRARGQGLQFHPLAVHPSRKVMAGGALIYNGRHRPGAERLRLKRLLEGEIKRMFLEMGEGLNFPYSLSTQSR